MPTLETPAWEILLRATTVYLVLAVVLRVIPKRNAGSLSPNDLIALVVTGALTADAISIGAASTPDLLLMIGVIFFWDFVLNWLEYHFPRFRRLAQDSPTLLIHRGRILRRNLRRELMTEEELAAALRKQGIADIGTVEQAVLEVDGQISMVERDSARGVRSASRRSAETGGTSLTSDDPVSAVHKTPPEEGRP